MYKECKSYADQAECVASLADAARSIKDRLGYPDFDARCVALANVEAVARSCQMVLNLLDSWTVGDNTVRQVIPQLIGLQTVTTEGIKYAGDALNKTSKLALAVLAQFQIENLLRCLAAELNIPQPIGFYKLATNLLDDLQLRGDELQRLNVPALIRNTLHNNGIHTGFKNSDTVVTIEEVTYEFRHGKPVHYASWQHIAHALESALGVVERVLDDQRVKALPVPVKDRYAWWVVASQQDSGDSVA